MEVVLTDFADQRLIDELFADCTSEILLVQVNSVSEAVHRLRDEVFDLVLLHFHPAHPEVLSLMDAMDAGGSSAPVMVLGFESEQLIAETCYQAGAADYLVLDTTTPDVFLRKVARAIEYHHLCAEKSRLETNEKQRFQKEKEEAQKILHQQRELILSHDGLNRTSETPSTWPSELLSIYRDLLRTYVMMGAGNLSKEMRSFASILVDSNVTSEETMELHLVVLEELIEGLGSRSSRHVMQRANLLALELIMSVATGYRNKLVSRKHKEKQLRLPGFECDSFQ